MSPSLIEPEPLYGDTVRLREVQPPKHPLVVRDTDVVQGRIATCAIVAAMAATAHARPHRIRALLGEPLAGDVFSKRNNRTDIFHWSTVTYRVQFNGGSAVVTPLLYFRGDQIAYAGTPDGPGWPSLVEKAYAVWRGQHSYQKLEDTSGPDDRMVLTDLGRVSKVGSP